MDTTRGRAWSPFLHAGVAFGLTYALPLGGAADSEHGREDRGEICHPCIPPAPIRHSRRLSDPDFDPGAVHSA